MKYIITVGIAIVLSSLLATPQLSTYGNLRLTEQPSTDLAPTATGPLRNTTTITPAMTLVSPTRPVTAGPPTATSLPESIPPTMVESRVATQVVPISEPAPTVQPFMKREFISPQGALGVWLLGFLSGALLMMASIVLINSRSQRP